MPPTLRLPCKTMASQWPDMLHKPLDIIPGPNCVPFALARVVGKTVAHWRSAIRMAGKGVAVADTGMAMEQGRLALVYRCPLIPNPGGLHIFAYSGLTPLESTPLPGTGIVFVCRAPLSHAIAYHNNMLSCLAHPALHSKRDSSFANWWVWSIYRRP